MMTLPVGTPLWRTPRTTATGHFQNLNTVPNFPIDTDNATSEFVGVTVRDGEIVDVKGRPLTLQRDGDLLVRVKGPCEAGDLVGLSPHHDYLESQQNIAKTTYNFYSVGRATEHVDDSSKIKVICVERGVSSGAGTATMLMAIISEPGYTADTPATSPLFRYFTAQALSGFADPVKVAKPPHLRVRPYRDDERAAGYPVPFIGRPYIFTGAPFEQGYDQFSPNLVYVTQNPIGGTGVIVNGVELTYQDANVDCRTWCIPQKVCLGGVGVYVNMPTSHPYPI